MVSSMVSIPLAGTGWGRANVLGCSQLPLGCLPQRGGEDGPVQHQQDRARQTDGYGAQTQHRAGHHGARPAPVLHNHCAPAKDLRGRGPAHQPRGQLDVGRHYDATDV